MKQVVVMGRDGMLISANRLSNFFGRDEAVFFNHGLDDLGCQKSYIEYEGTDKGSC